MNKNSLLGYIALIFLVSILFTPTDSYVWIWFLILGIGFGVTWWIRR